MRPRKLPPPPPKPLLFFCRDTSTVLIGLLLKGEVGGSALEILEPNCRITAPNNDDFSPGICSCSGVGCSFRDCDLVSSIFDSPPKKVDWWSSGSHVGCEGEKFVIDSATVLLATALPLFLLRTFPVELVTMPSKSRLLLRTGSCPNKEDWRRIIGLCAPKIAVVDVVVATADETNVSL